ncbi:hypothetical protein ACQUW5_06105 [Legionella sp. CNM-1927-20]|uniref:hypothetical protein n=1 Tax=Legionella sp. CNM-1927-20 TaxID=3422221 RepID=UPI00403A8459
MQKTDQEEIKEERVTKESKEEESIEVKDVPTFPDGKVGAQIRGNFIAKDNSSFFPVVKKDISDFNKLKNKFCFI